MPRRTKRPLLIRNEPLSNETNRYHVQRQTRAIETTDGKRPTPSPTADLSPARTMGSVTCSRAGHGQPYLLFYRGSRESDGGRRKGGAGAGGATPGGITRIVSARQRSTTADDSPGLPD